MDLFGKNIGNKNSGPTTNPQQPTKPISSILGAAGAFNQAKFNGSVKKPFSIFQPNNQSTTIDEGSDSSDDETIGSDTSSTTRVDQVKFNEHKNKNVNDVQDDKAPSNKKPLAKVSAANIISNFDSFEFHSKLRALGGRAGNENCAQSEISPRNIKSKSNFVKTAKSDFVSGPTANISRTYTMPVEEQGYNRSDISSDVSWGSDPGQQQQQQQRTNGSTIKVNPNYIIGNQYQPNHVKLPPHNNNNNIPHRNEWNTRSSDSRSEIMYRGKDKIVSSRQNSVKRNPRFNLNSVPGTMSDVTYQPKELQPEVLNYNPKNISYGENSRQHKPTVKTSARIPYSIDENDYDPSYTGVTNYKPRVVVEPQRKFIPFQLNEDEGQVESDDNDTIQNAEEEEENDEEIDELMNMTDDENIQRKLLELYLSNKELLTLNKSLEENINEQSAELENLPSFDSFLKTQKEQLEHVSSLENIIKDLTNKLSEQESQIQKIKDENNEREENKKTRVALFYDPRNLPLNTLPRIIYDRVYDDVTILYSAIKSLLYTFYIFPMIVLFRVTSKLLEKSKNKFLEITTE